MTPDAKPHGYVTRGIHWISAGLIAFGYFKGLDDVSQLSHPGVLQTEVMFAVALGAIFAVRLIWTKAFAGATRLPAEAPKWEHLASKAVHIGLYASVFAIALSGLGIALGYTVPAPAGFFVTAMVGLHEVALAALPLLLLAHIAGALWHKFVRRDKVLESMTGKLPL